MNKERKRKNIWILIAVIMLGAAGFAVAPYLLFDPSHSRVKLIPSFTMHFPLLLVHIFSSFIALAVGWVQFIPSIRDNHRHIHRLFGRIYLGCVAIGGVTGIIVGMYTSSYIRQMAFLTLAFLWLFTGWKGYRAVRKKSFEEHRLWMIRNYAITLVASTARIVTPICILIFLLGQEGSKGQGVQFVLDNVLEVNIWLGLVINIVISEWILTLHFKNTH